MSSYAARHPTDGAPSAFDQIAESYDEIFTRSVLGRAQRLAVWKVLTETFRCGERILELNCGTGEDALFLGRRGLSVLACDASTGMIEVAHKRKAKEGSELPVAFRAIESQRISSLAGDDLEFDGVFSNFSGLNCMRDLHKIALDLARVTARDAQIVLCLSGRYCLWEMLWFTAHLKFQKAFRRVSGSAVGHIGASQVRVWYPTVKQIQKDFAPWFRLQLVRAVGLSVPPSYLEYWAANRRPTIAKLVSIDRSLSRLPVFRVLGDHILLRLEKVSS